jgi:hypothetical protein
MASSGHSKHPCKRVWQTVFFPLIVFGLAVLGAGLWIQSHTWPPENPVFFTTRHEIPGYRFMPVELGSQVMEALGTTNIFNGHFFDSRSNRVSVYAAHWQPGQGGGNSVGHTPERCWVDTGYFRTIRCGEPSLVVFLIGGQRLPLQCRVLASPYQPTSEIVLWGACIGGRWDENFYGSPPDQTDQDSTVRNYFQRLCRVFVMRWVQACRLFQRPYDPTARKQFVRFSTPLTTEWKIALAELEAFAHQWLEHQ